METYKKYKQKFDSWFDRNRIAVGLALIVFVVFSGTVLMIQGANAQKDASVIKSTNIVQQTASKENPSEVKTEEIVFDIEGAVAEPGVYRLPVGSVLVDAIGKAGGLSVEADNERIARELNQASVIGNNAKLYIFKNSDKDIQVSSVSSGQAGSAGSTSGSSSSQPVAGAIVNLNTGTLQELDTLPKIGPALAQRIIDWRDANGGFEVIEDLKKVKGIGDATFDGLKDLITIE